MFVIIQRQLLLLLFLGGWNPSKKGRGKKIRKRKKKGKRSPRTHGNGIHVINDKVMERGPNRKHLFADVSRSMEQTTEGGDYRELFLYRKESVADEAQRSVRSRRLAEGRTVDYHHHQYQDHRYSKKKKRKKRKKRWLAMDFGYRPGRPRCRKHLFFGFLFVCCFWSGATQQKNGKRKERENGNEIHTIRHLWLIVEEREKGMKKDVFPLPDDWRRDFSSSLLVWPLLLSTSETPLSAGDGGNDPVSSSTGITKHMS